MEALYETEIVRRIFNNKDGIACTVEPDAEGGLVKIEMWGQQVELEPERALLVADAIKACATELLGRS